MQPIHPAPERVSVVDGALSLPLPPTSWATVVHWNRAIGAVPEFDLHVWSNASLDLTLAGIYGAIPQAHVLADDDVEAVDATTNELELTGHAYATGDGPVRITSDDTLPDGLNATTDYWVIDRATDSIALAASLQGALEGTAVDILDEGAGTHTISDTADTARLHWHLFGLLGPVADGEISLTALAGYTTRVRHSSIVVAYGIVATMSASDPETVSADVSPVVEV